MRTSQFQEELNLIDTALKTEREKALEKMNDQIEALAEKEAATGMITKDAAKKRLKQQMEDALENHDLMTTILEGFELVKRYQKEMLSIPEQIQFQTDLQASIAAMKKNKLKFYSLQQESFGISDFLMNSIQKIGYELNQKNALEDAQAIYSLLISLNPLVSDYYSSIATIYYKQGNKEEAVNSACIAVVLDSEDPGNYLLLTSLLIDIGNYDSAKEVIEQAEELVPDPKFKVDLMVLKDELAHHSTSA